MSTSRSTTAVSSPDSSEIAVARLVVRKVLPVPPLEENTEMTIPRLDGFSAIAPRSDRRLSAHVIARSTASRSSSLPWVRSTTSRMPARIAAGSSPFHDLSRTITIAVIGAARPTNSARPSASGSLISGDRTSTSTGSWPSTSTSSAAVTDCTQPTSSGSTSRARANVARNV